MAHKEKSQRFMQVCPFCFNKFKLICDHRCDSLSDSKKEVLAFREDLLSEEFFRLLYKQANGLDKKGNLDFNKLDLKKYNVLFKDIFNRLIIMENPSLETAWYERNLQDRKHYSRGVSDHKDTNDLNRISNKNSYKKLSNIKQVCPFCYKSFITLYKHQCDDLPSDLVFEEKISVALFFEELYLETNALSNDGGLDLVKMNRTKYQKLFKQTYNRFLKEDPNHPIDIMKSKQNKLKGSISLDNFDFGIEIDEEYKGMDLLELMDKDLDINLKVKKNKKKKSQLDTSKIPPDDGMPICFSCSNMVHCPKGYNSSQMETTYDCDSYSNMNVINETQSSTIKPKDVSICELCSKMDKCPRNLSFDEMIDVLICDFYVELNSEVRMKKKDLHKINYNDNNEFEEISQKETLSALTPISNLSATSPDFEKKKALEEILARRTQDKGKLKVFCIKCEVEMKKIVTTRKIFYRCSNYPECKVSADPWYISKAIEKNIVTHIEHGDLLILYKFDDSKNIVEVNQIYSDGKLFL